ncbi:unnamed protein product, partial [Discosporangium mesarthrocarpum]
VPSVCSNGSPGYQRDEVCCKMDCGFCGGVGCGAVPGTNGASDCCPTDIRAAGQCCGAGVVAPCLI